VDGTFHVVPSPYFQLYTVSFIKDFHVYPVIFALLKNKTFRTYSKLFELITALSNIQTPSTIKTDFKFAAISALQRSFPNAKFRDLCFILVSQYLEKSRV
jgi:hypothetical protein